MYVILTQIFVAVRYVTIAFDLRRHEEDTALSHHTTAEDDAKRHNIGQNFQDLDGELQTLLTLHRTAVSLWR